MVSATHGAVTAARAQELPLEEERGGPESAVTLRTLLLHSWRGNLFFTSVIPLHFKTRAFHPQQGKTLRLQHKSKKPELKRNFSNQRAQR